MARQPIIVGFIKKTFKSRFSLAKATAKHHLFMRLIDRLLFKDDEIYYLPKDMIIPIEQDAGPLPESMAVPSRLVDHFIDQASVHVVMHACICRDANHCKDYPIDLGCLFLGEAAARISPKLGHRVSKEEAKEHERKCREAGLVHMIGRNKLDSVWLNVKPGEKLLSICNCCPCCCLWKMLPDLSPDIARKVTRMPGISVHVTDKCSGCGHCMDSICFVHAIHVDDGKAVITSDCRGCGRCVEICPNHAIEIKIDDNLFVENAIAAIDCAVDVK